MRTVIISVRAFLLRYIRVNVYIKDSYVDGWVIFNTHGWPNRNPDSDSVLEDIGDRRMKGILLGGILSYRNKLTKKLLDGLT